MEEKELKKYLSKKSKEDLENIIINHYKFIVKNLEETKRQYDGFLKENMNICAENVKTEYKFILLQLRWYENFIEEEIKEV